MANTEIAQAAQAPHDETGTDDDAPQSDTPQSDTPAKRQHSRASLPDHLERQTEVPSPGDACASCGGALRTLGEDVTQELEYIPGRSASLSNRWRSMPHCRPRNRPPAPSR